MLQREFDFSQRYPTVPGSREKGGASEDAARYIRPNVEEARKQILTLLAVADYTADEICRLLFRDDWKFGRPRCSELVGLNLIHKTKLRRRVLDGNCTASVLKLGPKPLDCAEAPSS